MQEMINFCVAKKIEAMIKLWPMLKVNETIHYLKVGKPWYKIVLEMDDFV